MNQRPRFWTQRTTLDIYTHVLAFEIAPKEHLCKSSSWCVTTCPLTRKKCLIILKRSEVLFTKSFIFGVVEGSQELLKRVQSPLSCGLSDTLTAAAAVLLYFLECLLIIVNLIDAVTWSVMGFQVIAEPV